jgi:hypothetical protein
MGPHMDIMPVTSRAIIWLLHALTVWDLKFQVCLYSSYFALQLVIPAYVHYFGAGT